MRDASAAGGHYAEDRLALTGYGHAARAAREDAERDLDTAREARASMRSDWHHKLADRRKEVRTQQ